jgi:potassium/hydrogen antiporter
MGEQIEYLSLVAHLNIVLVILFLGALYFLAHAFAAVYRRIKIPDVLLLMIVGIFLGPIFSLVTPGNIGQTGTVFVSLTLIVILFQSGLGINVNTLLKASSRGIALTVANFLATMIISGIIMFFLAKTTLLTSFMFGAIVGGTSSAVVIPLIAQLKMQSESSMMLLLESVLTDVLCIVVALAFLDVLKGKSPNLGLEIGSIIASFLVASVLGIVAALIWAVIHKKMHTVHNSIFATLAFVFVVFGLVEFLGFAGYIAALAFGITTGNMESMRPAIRKVQLSGFSPDGIGLNETEELFFSEIVFIVKTFFFIYIGISIKIENSWWMTLGLFVTLAAFISRVVVVKMVVGKSTPPDDKSLMAVIGPKGLAAAALASLPLQQGVAGGEIIQNVTFAVVLFSITLASVLIFLFDKTPVAIFYRWIFSRHG